MDFKTRPTFGGQNLLLPTDAPRVNTLTAASNVYTPNTDTTDLAIISSPAAAFTIANPNGTAHDAQHLTIRITNGATAFVPSWGTAWLSSGIAALPTVALPVSKTNTLAFVYDANAAKWVLLAADTVGY